MRELKWDHQIVPIGQKVQDPLLHLCEKCALPILVYGRLSPCKHSFCLNCAEKGNGKCPRCGDGVQRIERAPLGSVYVCSVGGSRYGISGCRRSYFSQRDLQSHIKRRHQREQGGGESDGGEDAENEIQRAMFPQVAPFFPAPLREPLPAVPPHPILSSERPFGNVAPVPVMDARHFPGVPTIPRETFFMEGPRQQHPVVSGFPAQAPAPAPIPHVPQGAFPRPEQGPSPRFEEMRVPRPMAPTPIDEGFGPRPVGPGFPGRFPGPPRAEAEWIPGDRGPPVRGEREWMPPPGRAERDWIPPRGVTNMVPPGAPPPGRPPPGDPHFRPGPMF